MRSLEGSMIMKKLFVRLFFIICFIPFYVEAGNLFEVRDIVVDARGVTAVKARENARKQAQKKAFNIVLKRLTLENDWAILPDSSQINIQNYVRGFQLRDEKTASKRYLAKFTIQFDAESVLNMLKKYNISFIESQEKSALLLPILEDNSGYQFWQSHWWKKAWQSRYLGNLPAPMILPLGDEEDVAALSVEEILLGDAENLAKTATRYKVDMIIIMHAVVNDNKRLEVHIYQYSSLGSRLFIRQFKPSDLKDPSQYSHVSDLAPVAVDYILNTFADEWKKSAIVLERKDRSFTIGVDYQNMTQWLKILERLQEASFVKGVNTEVLTSNAAIISMNYTGSQKQLISNLAQLDLSLELYKNNGWRLKLDH